MMVLAAWLCATLVRVPAAVWATWPLLLAEGAATAGVTVIAAWAGLGNHRRWVYVPVCVIVFPTALMATWLRLWQRANRSSADSLWQSRATYASRAALVALTLAILVPAVSICWRLVHPRTIQQPAVPNPNGYDELVPAGSLIKGVNEPLVETATHSQLKAYVAPVQRCLLAGSAALDIPCQVPVRLDEGALMRALLTDVQSLRSIARAFDGRGRLAAMEGRTKDAVASYLDTIRLGRTVMRGGLIIDVLIGITCEAIGREGIANMRKFPLRRRMPRPAPQTQRIAG